MFFLFSQCWKGWTCSLWSCSIILCCHNISQVNILVYLGEVLETNLNNIREPKKAKHRCSLPQKVYPISQCAGCSFEAQRQLGWHLTVACKYWIFIRVHKQFLLLWVDQWVSDKWYLSSFIHRLRIHAVCWIGRNKSIFKQLKNIGQGSLSKPAIIPLACLLRYLY